MILVCRSNNIQVFFVTDPDVFKYRTALCVWLVEKSIKLPRKQSDDDDLKCPIKAISQDKLRHTNSLSEVLQKYQLCHRT